MFWGHLSHISILLGLPFVTAFHRSTFFKVTRPGYAELQKPVCADWRIVAVGWRTIELEGGLCCVCRCCPCLCSDPLLWPQQAVFQHASQPASSPAIGSLELIHPAEPCKAPFVPSCRLDQAGDRHSSLDWLSVSQPMAIHVQTQARARPSHHQIKGG